MMMMMMRVEGMKSVKYSTCFYCLSCTLAQKFRAYQQHLCGFLIVHAL